MQGKTTRPGLRKCYACRKPFTVKIGTIFEDSHIPLRMWLQAIALLCASKKGISSNQLHRMLGITLKSAWFMSHRIREAKKDDAPANVYDHRDYSLPLVVEPVCYTCNTARGSAIISTDTV